MKIENRQKFLAILVVALAALWVVVTLILPPVTRWWSARQAEIKRLQTQISDGQQLIRRADVIRSRWDAMRAGALSADTALAEQQMVRSVNDWVRSSGAELASLTPQWKNDDTNYLTLNCRVETSGDISSLTRLLYSFEKGPMALKVDSLELGARDKEGRQLTLSADLNGLALLPQPEKK